MTEKIVGKLATGLAGLLIFAAVVGAALALITTMLWLGWNWGMAPFDGVGRVEWAQAGALVLLLSTLRIILIPAANPVTRTKTGKNL